MKHKDPKKVRAGSKGGKAKNPKKGLGSLSPEERTKRSREAALKRWGKREEGEVG